MPFLKDSFAKYGILAWQFFIKTILNMSFHCLLASMVSDEKLGVNFIENCLYMISYFSLLSTCSVCLSFDLNILVLISAFILLGVCWDFFYCVDSYVSSNMGCFQPVFLPMLSHCSHVQRLPHELPTRFLCPWILEQVAMPSLGDLPDPGIESMSLMSPALAGRYFTTEPQGSLISIPQLLSLFV